MRHRKTAVITGDGFRGSLNPGDEVSLRNVELAVVDGDVDVRITDDKCRSHLRHACTERTRCREQSQEYNEDLETREHSSVHADPKELFPAAGSVTRPEEVFFLRARWGTSGSA